MYCRIEVRVVGLISTIYGIDIRYIKRVIPISNALMF